MKVLVCGSRDWGDQDVIADRLADFAVDDVEIIHGACSRIRLTSAQQRAVVLLRKSRHPGVITSSKSVMVDGQPWIHWMTAYALHDKGVVRITDYGEDCAEVHLA